MDENLRELVHRVAILERRLDDMTLMRDMLLRQLEDEGIDPVVRVTRRQ
jgi:hypothetical protein